MLRRPLPLPVAVAVAVLAALALAACSGGGSGEDSTPLKIDEQWAAACAEPLPPGRGVPSAERFQIADEGLAEVGRLAAAGDLTAASAVFFSRAHDLTHDIDGQLRDADDDMATELCSVIAQMEADFAFGDGAESMAALAARARELMREASDLLGYAE